MSKVELEVQGKRAQLIVKGNKGNGGPGKRGKAGVFSKASRKRMSELVARLGDALPVFVTLTYGAEWSKDHKDWKRHMDTFFKRLIRKYPNISGIWKLEPQKRMAPHFHLLAYGGKIDKDWLALAWAECSEDTSIEHIQAGTRVESVRSARGSASYCSKYLCKVVVDELPDYWKNVGHWWGKFNKSKLPFAAKKSYFMDLEVAVLFRDFLSDRLLNHLKNSYIRKNKSDPEVYKKANKEVKLEKWSKPTSTYIDNLRDLLDAFQSYSSAKMTMHCLIKCKGSTERATVMCLKVFEQIKDFITGTGLPYVHS